MSKEIDYQNKAQNYIEQLISQRTGITTSMYTEEFDTTYNYALQEARPEPTLHMHLTPRRLPAEYPPKQKATGR